MIKLRKYVELFDYRIISEWWKAHDWPVIPPSSLPRNGVMVCRGDDTPIFAAFLYLTDSNIAWLEWGVSDPKSKPDERATAIMGGVTYLTELAKTLGAKNIFTSAKNTRYLEKLKSCDFKETDVGMTNLIRSL